MSHKASKLAIFSSKRLVGSTPIAKQKGSALVLAVFIIVVMTVLGAALARMMSSSSETIAYEVLGTRAYAAAQSGIQWKLTQLFPLGNNTVITCSSVNTTPPDISAIEGLKSCKIKEVSCTPFQYNDANDNDVFAYTVASTGQCFVEDGDGNDANNPTLTSRTIEVEARNF